MKRRRKARTQPTIPVASMGDVAMLLIIFFILCSQFLKGNIKAPVSLDVVELQERHKVLVEVGPDGTVYLQGREVPNVDAVEWGVKALLEKSRTDRERTVMFRCDRAVSRKKFEPVLEAISRGGGIVAAYGQKGDVALEQRLQGGGPR